MPGRDGTGPSGKGPMTGRGMGYSVWEIAEGMPAPHMVRQDVAESGERSEDKLKETRKERTAMPAGDGTGPR